MRYFDPLYGLCQFTSNDLKILACPEVQRLRYVRMCNINSLLIPGASEISRFEHSLGVLRLAHHWASTHEVPEQARRIITSAALLHDFLTPPFGHSIQYVLEDTSQEFSHEKLNASHQKAYYQRIDSNASFAGRPFRAHEVLGRDWDDVAGTIQGSGRYGPLISGTLDLDNIDNVLRLAFHVGLTTDMDKELPLKLAAGLSVNRNGELEIRRDCLALVERWQSLRQRLYSILLLDWAEFSAKAMLTYVVERSMAEGLLGPDSWRLTDLELLAYVEQASVGRSQDISEISRRLRCGELYQPIALVETADTSLYEDLSRPPRKREAEARIRTLARATGRESGVFLFHVILDRKKTLRSVKLRVLGSDEQVQLGEDSSRILVGVFGSATVKVRPGISTQSDWISQVLLELGINEWRLLPDPLDTHPVPETRLL